jgi:hypothetical protein
LQLLLQEDEAKVAEFHARQAAKAQPSNQIGAPEVLICLSEAYRLLLVNFLIIYSSESNAIQDQFHGVIDREVQVFPAALLVTMSALFHR